ncbi:MAG: 3-deoxy-D-manno-octulosonic acid transferase [Acidobacteriota bacterium]|nr:MAG: 3-deoxy-D-manno-octulosonic acid transferase [Acidobacteriota bacterium]
MFRISLFLYSMLLILGALIYAPILLYQRLVRGKKSAIIPRFWLGSKPDTFETDSSRARIWIHAVSVGEVNAIRPLAERCLQQGFPLLISTTTITGQEVARNLFAERATVFYFPLDFRFICRKAIRCARPQLILLAETEIWPNFLAAARQEGVPVILVNGRISDQSYERYLRFRFFFRPVLNLFDHFCVQTRSDKERIIAVGADPDRVNWIGNLKYDYKLTASEEKQQLKQKIAKLLAVGEDHPLLLCGSTKPGEEDLLLQAYTGLRKRFPGLRLLIAPRHPHRGPEVRRLVESNGLSALLRSQLKSSSSSAEATEIMILDSVGELAHLYEIADIVFVGGSLVDTGGQNIIEPASFGKPILFGPHMENFREIARAFKDNYAALEVGSIAEFEQKVADLLEDAHARQWLGRNARKVIRDNQGAIERTFEIVRQRLEDQS